MKAKLLLAQSEFEKFWAARNPRERLILSIGAAALIVLAYWLAISSLQSRIVSLQRKLPELMLNSYEIAGGGDAVTPRAARAADLRSDLYKILADRGLKAELRALSTDQVEMRLPDQDAKTLIGSLNALRLSAGARVLSIQIRAAEAGGEAGSTVVLERMP